MDKFTFVIARYKGQTYLEGGMYQTTKAAIEDIASGQIDANSIEKIVENDLIAGTSRDVTRFVALEVWRIFDSDNYYPWKEMRDWLEAFSLDCDHLEENE